MNQVLPVRDPAGPSPLRRPGSVRRTSTIDTSWPDGMGQPMLMLGHARDLLTSAPGTAPVVLAEDRMRVLASPLREILEIETDPRRVDVAGLVGARAGGHLRAVLNEQLPGEAAAGSPLYLLIDDLAGASLVAGWAWSRWNPDWLRDLKARAGTTAGRNGNMEGICVGFAPGSSALHADGTSSTQQSSAAVPPLPHPDDPEGWHALGLQTGVGMRRARRIDVWREGGEVVIDAAFQDSATAPDGGNRIAVHEYTLSARADEASGRLTELVARPHVLPYAECPAARTNVQRLIGETLHELRASVLLALARTAGCTHLNDALRAFAEVPQMLAALDARSQSAPAR